MSKIMLQKGGRVRLDMLKEVKEIQVRCLQPSIHVTIATQSNRLMSKLPPNCHSFKKFIK